MLTKVVLQSNETKVLYYKSKQRCITKVLYYKSKQRCYDQSIVLQSKQSITKVNKDVWQIVL